LCTLVLVVRMIPKQLLVLHVQFSTCSWLPAHQDMRIIRESIIIH
jgi:hypothetical protein